MKKQFFSDEIILQEEKVTLQDYLKKFDNSTDAALELNEVIRDALIEDFKENKLIVYILKSIMTRQLTSLKYYVTNDRAVPIEFDIETAERMGFIKFNGDMKNDGGYEYITNFDTIKAAVNDILTKYSPILLHFDDHSLNMNCYTLFLGY